MVKLELQGKQFGRLLVVASVPSVKGKTLWECQCECGHVGVHHTIALTSGRSKSCGCLRNELQTKHGHNSKIGRTTEYTTWDAMLQRCLNPKNRKYPDYGGRGITVCARWRESFSNFLQDLGKKPSPELTLDRIDNNGDYTPDNCRWTTYSNQNRNRRPSGSGRSRRS